MIQLPENSNDKQSWWSKPQGTTGMIFAAALILGGGYLLYMALPYIITLLQNTILAIILGVALAGILYVLMDPKVHNMIWYLYKTAMTKITSAFVKIDPILIMKVYIQELKDRRSKMNTKITDLKAHIGRLVKKISDNAKKIEAAMEEANAAQRMNNGPQMTLKTREAGRYQDFNAKLTPLKERMDGLYEFMKKIYDNSGYMIQDKENEVLIAEEEYEMVKAGHSAMQTAMSIFKGDDDKTLMAEQAMEFLRQDIGMKLGEMERFMDVSESVIDSIDIQNSVYDEKGLKMLEEWNANNEFADLITSSQNAPVAEAVLVPVKLTEPTESKHKSFFD